MDGVMPSAASSQGMDSTLSPVTPREPTPEAAKGEGADPDIVQFTSAGEGVAVGRSDGTKGFSLSDSHSIDLRLATEGMAMLLIISVLQRSEKVELAEMHPSCGARWPL